MYSDIAACLRAGAAQEIPQYSRDLGQSIDFAPVPSSFEPQSMAERPGAEGVAGLADVQMAPPSASMNAVLKKRERVLGAAESERNFGQKWANVRIKVSGGAVGMRRLDQMLALRDLAAFAEVAKHSAQ